MVSSTQFSYNGLTLGTGTVYSISHVDGLGSMPTVKADDQSRAVTHGAFTFGSFVNLRIVTISGTVYANGPGSTFQTAVEALKAAFLPQVADLPLSFLWPGQVAQRLNCKPSRLDIPQDPIYSAAGKADWTLELMAGDPRIYSDASTALVGGGTATNTGTVGSPPIAVLTGTTTNPTITNTTTGQVFKLLRTGSGTVTIDFANHTVQGSGGASLYPSVDPANSDWIQLAPGANTITYSGGGTETLTYRSAWL